MLITCSVLRVRTRLDFTNAANSLQIGGKGVLPGGPMPLGGVGTRNTRP